MQTKTAPAHKAIRALLFDLGNVLIDVDFYRCARIWSVQAGVPVADLAARFRIDSAYRAFECGALGASAYFQALRRQLRIDLPDPVMREGWQAIIRGEKPGIRRCLRRLQQRYPLYVMTNTNAEHERVWSETHRELMAVFKAVFVSSRMGCRKPETEAFRKVAQSIGQDPSRILFFDDSAENIQGARRSGMSAVLVDKGDTIRHWTDRLLGGGPGRTKA
jgi:putative hydrolase of the HAD superfamily